MKKIKLKMSKKTPWPVNKGFFRSAYQTEFIPQRSPSPIIEMPLSPEPDGMECNGHAMSPPPLRISTSMERSMSPRAQSPFSPTYGKAIREIPIEVQQDLEVNRLIQDPC